MRERILHFFDHVVIQLLLVVTALAILAAMVTPKFTSEFRQARVKAAINDIGFFKQALSDFKAGNNRYPTTEEGLQALAINPGDLPEWRRYMKEIPVDPWGHPYVYRCPGSNGADYDLYCTGKSGQDGAADNIHL